MDKGVVVDIGNDIEGFVPISQLGQGAVVNSPADVVYEGMNLDTRVLEVDPIHRRIVLSVVEHPGGAAAPSGGTPSKIQRTTATRSRFLPTLPSKSSHRTVQRKRDPLRPVGAGSLAFAILRSHALRGSEGDSPGGRASPRKRARYGRRAALPRSAHIGWRTARDDPAPLVAGARTDVDDPVARGDHAHVVLDHDHGVARVHESVQLRLQALDVRWVQPGRGLVQHVQRVAALRALQLGRELDAAALAAGELGGRLAEAEIAESRPPQDVERAMHVRIVGEEPGRVIDREAAAPRRCSFPL
jgi:predicted RNA-binding protein with RPS1 domain